MSHDMTDVFEFKLHGWYKHHEDDAGYADTFWVPIHRLKHLPVGQLNASFLEYLKASRDVYVELMSSWFEEGEEHAEEGSSSSE